MREPDPLPVTGTTAEITLARQALRAVGIEGETLAEQALRAAGRIDALSQRTIEASNPGIDMDGVREVRGVSLPPGAYS